MPVTLLLRCGGCFATIESRPLRREFASFSGRGYGFGFWQMEKPEDIVPEGWVGWDPYTAACYCAACWASIIGPDELDPVEVAGAEEVPRG